MVGANRLVLGNGIVYVVGDAGMAAAEEQKVRRQLVEKALAALGADEKSS